MALDPLSPLGLKLTAHRVRIRDDGPQSVILQNVPGNARFFNKRGTNVMVKQAHDGGPFLIAVDADLRYTGPDATLAKAFAAGATQQGWRIVFFDSRRDVELPRVVEDALRVVGFDGEEPAWVPPAARPETAGGSLAARFGVDLADVSLAITVGRADVVADVVSGMLMAHPRLPVVLGESGVGKSHLLTAVAQTCADYGPVRMTRVDLGHVFAGTLMEAERENVLGALIEESVNNPNRGLALERFDLVFTETSHGPAMLGHAVESGAHIVASARPGLLPKLEASILARHLQVLVITPLAPHETMVVVHAALPALAAHHGVMAHSWLATPIVERSGTFVGFQPANALALADAACARARMAHAAAVDLAHVAAAARTFAEIEA